MDFKKDNFESLSGMKMGRREEPPEVIKRLDIIGEPVYKALIGIGGRDSLGGALEAQYVSWQKGMDEVGKGGPGAPEGAELETKMQALGDGATELLKEFAKIQPKLP